MKECAGLRKRNICYSDKNRLLLPNLSQSDPFSISNLSPCL